MIGLFGGAFNPPHLGHLALAEGAFEAFPLGSLQVLVSGDPAHKDIDCPVETRVALAELAFAGLANTMVRADPYRYTVDLLRAERPANAIFLIGADQYRDFPTWCDPAGVLALAQLGVATRAGVVRPAIPPEHDGRVHYFEIDSPPVASRDVRERARRGEPLDALVPRDVAAEIARRRLYRPRGYTDRAISEET